ncbi:MAG: DUF1501 domain-containing protein [Leptospiraceae bacterium]|nr:DUF1501 domain-containing protein [Leptospiraceae bacterium]
MFTNRKNTHSARIDRASFLKRMAVGTGTAAGLFGGGSWLKQLAAREQTDVKIDSPVKSVIFINMAGGMSHVDTFDPKPGNGKFRSIRASNGAQVSEVMPRLAAQMKHVNLVRSLHSQEGSHERGAYLIHTGHKPNAAFQDIPSFGAVIAMAHDMHKPADATYFPAHITLGGKGAQIGKGGFLGVQYDSFHIGNLDRPLSNLEPHWYFKDDSDFMRGEMLNLVNTNFKKRVASSQIQTWEQMHRSAREFMNSPRLKVFNLDQESAKNKARYGSQKYSKAMLMLKRLAEIEVPFMELTIGGWDTHNNNFDQIRKNWAEIDQPLAALVEELAGSGLLKQTMIVINSEFGRTVEVNADRDGRDHHPRAWTALIAGGNLPRGVVYGATDQKAFKPEKDPVTVEQFISTIYKSAGIDPRKTLYTALGRPFTLIDNPNSIPGFI